jgi:hypothetical protein
VTIEVRDREIRAFIRAGDLSPERPNDPKAIGYAVHKLLDFVAKSDGDDQRDTQHARAPAGVTRNSGSPHPVMDGLQPVPSAAPDRATLTNADQHKASAAEADRGLTRRGDKGGWL